MTARNRCTSASDGRTRSNSAFRASATVEWCRLTFCAIRRVDQPLMARATASSTQVALTIFSPCRGRFGEAMSILSGV